ncbi:hypothetical protein WJX73_003139 [Symbiochloris irregularis]|uniref:Uncharacterized protein n=1 Tax=Symbiochloris irregularis TaxID=706552 RepID=A0AAW1PK72_9CHLO
MRQFAALNFDIDGVLDGLQQRVRTAADALEEFPAQNTAESLPVSADWSKIQGVISFWSSFDLERRKVVLSDTLQTGDHVSTQDKAKAQQLLQELAALLLQAPDPLPFLVGSQELQQALTEVQKENRRLQKDTQAAENEATSAISMVGQVQKLEAARTETESKLHAETEKALL